MNISKITIAAAVFAISTFVAPAFAQEMELPEMVQNLISIETCLVEAGMVPHEGADGFNTDYDYKVIVEDRTIGGVLIMEGFAFQFEDSLLANPAIREGVIDFCLDAGGADTGTWS